MLRLDSVPISRPKDILLLSVLHGVNEFYSIALPPILPLLIADLDISYTQAGLLLSVFFLMYSVFQLPAGMIADRLGKTRLLVAGMVGMAAGIGLAATAQSYEMLILSQVVAGASGSTFHPAGMALISDIESADTDGTAMGVFGFGGMVGVAAAPVIVGGIGSFVHWRAGIAAAVLTGMAGIVLFHLFFEDPAAENRSSRVLLPSLSGATGWTGSISLSGFRSALAGTNPGRVWNRLRRITETPLTSGIGLLLLVTVFVSLQSRAIQTFTTSYVILFQDGQAWVANAAFLALLVGGSISSLWAGLLADRWNRTKLGATTSVITAALLVAFTALVGIFVTAPSPIFALAVILWFFVLGNLMYACVPIKNAIVSKRADRGSSGSTFGLIQSASAVGSTIGPALFGSLATHVSLPVAYPSIAAASLTLGGVFAVMYMLESSASDARTETEPTDAS